MIKKYQKSKLKLHIAKVKLKLKTYPILSSILLCLTLVSLLGLGKYINFISTKPKTAETKVKKVHVMPIGQSSRVNSLSTVSKSGTYEVYAQTAGVMQKIFVKDGQTIKKGQPLAYISSNYQGASIQSVSRQIAQKQLQSLKDNEPIQLDLIAKQKDIANEVDINGDKLRDISKSNLDRLKDQQKYNQELLDEINHQLESLTNSPLASTSSELIASTKQLKSQLISGNNQLLTSIDSLNYTTNADNPPYKMENLTRDITIKGLDIQEKGVKLQIEIAELQLKLANINESLTTPTSITAGVVEKVHIKNGQVINPGTLLFSLSSPLQQVRLDAAVSQNIAKNYSQLETARVTINDQVIELSPNYISSEATNGTLYNINFVVPDEYTNLFTDKASVLISLPVGYPKTTKVLPLIPIDAVYQTNIQDIVYVMEDDKAVAKKVTLGNVFGEYVLIKDGLSMDSLIILDDFVVDGDMVESI